MTDIVIAGCGFIGRIYAQVIPRAGGRVVAVVDPIEAARMELAERTGCPAFANLVDALDAVPSIAAVGISSSSQHHHELAMGALRAGKNVLLEKPLALSLVEAEEIVTTARDGRLKLAMGLKMRFEPAFAEVRRRVREGDIGTLKRVVVTQHQPLPAQDWARRHGIANELLVHGMDLANWLLGAAPERLEIAASLEEAAVFASYGGRREAVVSGAWVEGFPQLGGKTDTMLQAVGTDGHIVVLRPRDLYAFTGGGTKHVTVPEYDYSEPFRHEWAAFIDWISGKPAGDLATEQDALNVHRMLAEVDRNRRPREGNA